MNYIGGLSNELYQRFVQLTLSEGCPIKGFSEMVQWFDTQRWSSGFKNKKLLY